MSSPSGYSSEFSPIKLHQSKFWLSALLFILLAFSLQSCDPPKFDFRQDTWKGMWGSDGQIMTGDLNGDHRTDVFMWRESSHDWTINLSTAYGFQTERWDGAWGSDGPIHTGDLNGDGKTDVFMWNDNLKVWTINLSTGSGFSVNAWGGAWGSDGEIFTGDLDGDGKTDIFVRRKSQKDWTVNLSTGDGFILRLWHAGFGMEGPAQTGDLNGDGKTDVFLWDEPLKVWMVDLSDGNDFNQSLWTGAWGSDGTIFTGDLNGDGKTDVFMRENANQWTVNISSGVDFSGQRWNGDLGTGDNIVTGDLNGDRMTDIFLWNDTKKIWALDISTGTGFKREDWTGSFVPGARILTGDMDGDHKTDLVMWKDADKTWSLNVSSYLVTGKLVCVAPDRNPANMPITTTTNIYAAKVSNANSFAVTTDVNGVFKILWFDEPTTFSLRLYYEGEIFDNNPNGATPLQIMDDGHNTRSNVFNRNPVPPVGRKVDLGTIQVKTIDCELWRIGVQLLADYHSVMHKSPPAGRLRIKRWENVVVGTPLTFYDYITVPTDFMTDTEYPSSFGRQSVLFHEFGHSIRHVADGSHGHWNNDNVKYIYAQDHGYNTLHNKGFAFNEGWGNFWEQARSLHHSIIDFRQFTCITPGQRDWNEARVANQLLLLRAQLEVSPVIASLIAGNPGSRDNILDSCMVSILLLNPEEIHSLRDFELQVELRVPVFRAAAVNDCPEGFTDDGLFCRRDATSIAKSPRKDCPCGFHDHGPTCFRNSLIFTDH